ncbi:hypothetical protein C2G38_2161136 [Gigaspora rosea]|uniref:Uncharacterized protein n=1 Tax=Gigaspora rosea TaxID=44941 RepID=A0A397VXD8_9GLOM|nr:hypothetical protein C2G38_2161136 [Gigaspora rosea]
MLFMDAPYLQPSYQICSPHYMAIVENQLPEPTSAPAQAFIPTLPVKPSIGDQIKKMTSVLYTKRHDNMILDPNEFDKMLKETDPKFNQFFADIEVYLATCVAKSVEKSDPVPFMFNNKSVYNPNNINASIICEKLINQYKIKQLSTYFYDNAIKERKEECKMKCAILVGVKEQQLHSMQDYLNTLNIVFDYNKEIGHLDGNENLLPILRKAFSFCVWQRKILAKKPRPWRTNLLLELAFREGPFIR